MANADAHNGASGNGGNGGSGGGRGDGHTRGEEGDGDEEWDCHFTDLAVLTYPKGQPEGDPSKVNEYEFEKYLGAGAFISVLRLQCHVWGIRLDVAASSPGCFFFLIIIFKNDRPCPQSVHATQAPSARCGWRGVW